LREIDTAQLLVASHSVQDLVRDVLPNKKARFIRENAAPKSRPVSDAEPFTLPMADPGHGVFSVSEIAFDEERNGAILGYSFACGLDCGTTVILRLGKSAGEWKTGQECISVHF